MRRHIVIAAVVVVALVLAALAANAWLRGSPTEGQVDGPVVAIGEDWDDYPVAQVSGTLTLVDGCLLLGDAVVFWPHGTTWDEDRREVGFGGDFEDAAPAVVGAEFTGGGGFYSAANVRGLESLDADALIGCQRGPDADGFVLAYPDHD